MAIHPFGFILSFIAILLFRDTNAEPVQVQLETTTVIGDYNAMTGVDAFLGVKYADSRRFEHAVMTNYSKQATIKATEHSPACPQTKSADRWNYGRYGFEEDCLYLEIYRPHHDRFNDTIPVLVWIHGGSRNNGAASNYLGYNFVNQSLAIDMPVIVVTINYRLAVWGMLGGKEASLHEAVNLGLYDQRTALEWVQKYIGSFGGDKSRVTLWGQSSGSMDSHLHYLDENSELFRAAIMESGNIYSVPALDTSFYQDNYNALVKAVGCDVEADNFHCLKTVDMDVLQQAVYEFMAKPGTYSTRPWGLVIDGRIIPDTPSKLLAQGQFAKKPFIHGDVLDEGTSYPQPIPMETIDQMWAYFETDYLSKASTWLSNAQTKAKILEYYPAEPAEGSPFDTGPEGFGYGSTFKRAAAIYGDVRYQAPRRSWFEDASRYGVTGWAYQLSQVTPSWGDPPAYGVAHSTDLPYVFLEIPNSGSDVEYYNLAKTIVNHWIIFAYNMDPNYKQFTHWPSYGINRNLMNFGINDTKILPDDYREEAMAYLNSIQDQFGNPRKPDSQLVSPPPKQLPLLAS